MKKRYLNLDLARTIAVILIISNHVLSAIYVNQTNYAGWLSSNLFEKIFILVSYILSRLGVPLFLFITGALILEKEFNTKEDIKKFYKKNLLPLVLCVCSWNIIYYFFVLCVDPTFHFSLKDLIYRVLFMESSVMPHMWYMPMIIGMYIFLPFVSIIVKKFKLKDLLFPLLVVTVASFLLPNLKVFLTFFGYSATNIQSILDLHFGGGVYGIYIILGYYLYRNQILEKIKSRYLWLIFIFSCLFSCCYQMIGYMSSKPNIVYYDFFGILIAGICLFELIRRFHQFSKDKLNKTITYLSRNALALYFVHRPLVYIYIYTV